MNHRSAARALGVLVGMGGLWAGTAGAVIYGSPARDYGGGKYSAGISYSDHSRDMESDGLGSAEAEFSRTNLNLGIGVGVGAGGEIGLHGGLITVDAFGESESGEDYGISYRQRLEVIEGLQEEVFLSYRYGYFYFGDTGGIERELELWQYDLGFGVAKEVQQGLAVYGGGVLSSLEATYYEYYEYGIESENLLGVYGGAEFSPSRNFALGVEVHALSETAFGAYADYRF